MGDRVLARREALGASTVFGLLDGDFVQSWAAPLDTPRRLIVGDKSIHVGWRWERKEIENYLVDPAVVSRTIDASRLAPHDYAEILERAASTLAEYQAARTALSNCRRNFKPLPSAFGKKRGKEGHPFPEALTEQDCRKQLTDCVVAHASTQAVSDGEVLDEFEQLLPSFQPGGPRRTAFLHAFSGKDLLWAMDSELKLFNGAMAFRELILTRIDQTREDIGDWMAEWKELRKQIQAVV